MVAELNLTGASSRRSILGAGAFTFLTGIAAVAIAKPDAQIVSGDVPTQHSDAAPIALADKYMALQVQVDEINAGKPHTEEELDNLVIAQAEILDEMNEHIVTTMNGHQARARVLTAWYQFRGLDDCPHELDEHRIWPLVRDLIGGPV